MRIIHVIGTLGFGGAQSLLVDLASSQKLLGHDVSVIELSNACASIFRKPLLEKGITIQAVSNSSVYSIKHIIKVSNYIKSADIVHVHLFPALYWVALSKKFFGGNYKLLYTEHSTHNKRRGARLWRFLDKWIYQSYDRIVACSDSAKSSFDEAFPTLCCLSIPNGINLTKFKNAQAYDKNALWGVAENTRVSTMVARFEYPKRQEVIVEALKELPDKFHCALVGGAEGQQGIEKVKKIAEDEGVLDRVHFMYTRSDVPQILKSSDFIILSSDFEGLSLSMLEGMSVGKPFIASEAPGLTDVVAGSGILFSPGDAHALASVLRELDENVTRYEEVAKLCAQKADEYDINNVAQKYIEVYKQVLNNKYDG
jgi:glycosyltransferase involved in cell wall biosynthesis